MLNWLNQDIEVGDYVYRGARDGNTSSFKVGRVSKLTPEKKTARVEWLYEPGNRYDRKLRQVINGVHSISGSAGSPTIDSLVKIDAKTIEYLEYVVLK